MMDLKQNFIISNTSIGSDSYLVLELLSDENKIQQFQVEMIVRNSIPGILPIDIRQADDKIKLYYNVTSKQPLALLFSRKKFSGDEFITLLYNMVNIITESEKYLLTESRFIIDEEYIYVNPSTLDVSLLYLPMHLEEDIIQNLKQFITKMILETVNLDTNNKDNYLQDIIIYLRDESINLNDFKIFLNGLRGNKVKSAPKYIGPQIEYNKVPVSEPMTKEDIPASNENINIPKININIPNVNNDMKKESKKSKKDKQKVKTKTKGKDTGGTIVKKYKTSSLILAALSQLVILGLIIKFWQRIKYLGDNISTTMVGLILVIGGIDYFLFKNLFKKENMVEKVVIKENKSKENKGKRKVEIPKPKKIEMDKREIRNVEQEINYNEIKVDRPIYQEEITTNVQNQIVDETTLIDEKSRPRKAFLQGYRNGLLEEIIISKSSFIIGRLPDQVDYVSDNRAVGKIHAEIIVRDESYYIKDLNSKNGTYINGEKLISQREYPIKNNDKLTLADSNFTFIILE